VIRIRDLLTRFLGKREPPDSPSVIVLLREPLALSQDALEAISLRTWPDFATNTEKNFVVKEGPVVIVKHGDEALVVLNTPRPFSDDPEREAASIRELRRRKAWSDHRAFISVLYQGESTGEAELGAWKLMGRFVAELAGPSCTGIYFPVKNAVVPNTESLADDLRSFQSLETLQGEDDARGTPVVEVDESKWQRARAEAEAHWPDFVRAFSNRQRSDVFLVKALFQDGSSSEWMWVQVTALQGDRLSGTLKNAPVEVNTVRSGDEVRLPVSEVGDWCYIQRGVEHGYFSREVQ
jgi:uncharacterized protein YegJ (DUF2314 family)